MNPFSNNFALTIGSFSKRLVVGFGTAFLVAISILNIEPLLHIA